jgi:hypothetical protein
VSSVAEDERTERPSRSPLAGLAGRIARAAALLPLLREAQRTLGPMVSPAVAAAQQRVTAERHARRQAAGLVNGSWMPVYVGPRVHWVVWSGDEPVNAFPPLDGDLVAATRHVDLRQRRGSGRGDQPP